MNKLHPIIRYSIVLTAITLVVALLLAQVNNMTAKIITTRQAAAQTEARAKVLAGTAYDIESFKAEDRTDEYEFMMWEYQSEGATVAYAVQSVGQGYGGAIEIMIGINAEFNILGVDILSQTETPGLGSKAAQPQFLEQFAGKTAPIEGIAAISGATVTTKAVTGIIAAGIDYARITAAAAATAVQADEQAGEGEEVI
ncbi:MAG: FMN-binding protein [Clostridiales bacterium]|jgi:electron transport complex protein RnfG|nr:FMN-binding protein [Clostridiales bacterium]